MKLIHVDRTDINLERLNNTLRSQLIDDYIGIGMTDKEVTVYLSESADMTRVAQARQIVHDHDATRLTDAQRALQEQTAQLEAARANDTAIESDELQAASPLLQKMAQKLRLLELEIREIRRE